MFCVSYYMFACTIGCVLPFHFWGGFAQVSNKAPGNGPGFLWLAGSPPATFPSTLLFFMYFSLFRSHFTCSSLVPQCSGAAFALQLTRFCPDRADLQGEMTKF